MKRKCGKISRGLWIKKKTKTVKREREKSKECEELRQHFDQKFMDGKVKKKKAKKINTFP